MAKATEYRLDAQASGTAELVAATHGACWQNAMFGRIRYARPKTTYAGVHGCPPCVRLGAGVRLMQFCGPQYWLLSCAMVCLKHKISDRLAPVGLSRPIASTPTYETEHHVKTSGSSQPPGAGSELYRESGLVPRPSAAIPGRANRSLGRLDIGHSSPHRPWSSQLAMARKLMKTAPTLPASKRPANGAAGAPSLQPPDCAASRSATASAIFCPVASW